jgi:regulator of protease activity HflC (stomatin/prohibitin superfamily)
MLRITIDHSERGLLFKDGRLVEFLVPGRYLRFGAAGRFAVRRLSLGSPSSLILELDELGPEVEAIVPASEAELVLVPDEMAVAITLDDRPLAVRGPGRYLVWKARGPIETSLFDLAGLVSQLPDRFWPVTPEGLLKVVLVRPWERVLVYADGVLALELEAGRHGLSPWRRELKVERMDMREQELQVGGQEMITHDKVSLRLNLMLKYRVVEAVNAAHEVVNLHDALYSEVQIAARDVVGSMPVDELLEGRGHLAARLTELVRERAAEWGVRVLRLDVKDIVLPGDMKLLLNQVIEAEKKAAAQVILRREEVAATRSLANTARMLEQNPVLLRLKEIEALKELAERVPNLTVVVGGNELEQRLQLK